MKNKNIKKPIKPNKTNKPNKPFKSNIKKNNPVKEKTKLKSIKTINAINGAINDIYIFDNKNFLISAGNIYKIYNEKYFMVKNIKTNYLDNIKIIDNNNFICLKDKTELINISVKSGKQKTIFNFNEKIDIIIYYKNKYITKSEELKGGIKIWKKLKNGHIELITKFIFYPKIKHRYDDVIYLIPEQNLLLSSGYMGDIDAKTYFWNLKTYKVENIFEDKYDLVYKLNSNLFIFTNISGGEIDSILNIYNIREKKFVKTIELKFYHNSIEVIPKKEIILISGYEYNGFGSAREYNDIHIFDFNFKEIQVIKKVHFRSIVGMKFYEKNENEDLVLSFSEDGSINFLSFN